VLLNVHPCHRSSLRFIQLLAVAKSCDIRTYGIDAVLEPVISDLQTLANVSTGQIYHCWEVVTFMVLHIYDGN